MKMKNGKKIGLLSVFAVIIITVVLAATVLTSSAAYADGIPAEFTENTDPAKDYAYSFAVIGDTQKHVYRDVYYGKDTTSYIYDWIVANKDSKKISLVMGLGDITDKDGVDQTADDGIDQTDLEWDIAVEQHAKLENAGIPYTLVRGNHDTVAKLDEYFAANPNFTGGEIGYYDGTSLGNYYMKFTIGGHKYMVFVFDYGPHNDILTWASGEIAANPDYKVILTTHAYMCKDGTTFDANNSVPPRKANYTSSRNNGNDIWYKLASQHENIILVLSGHDPNNDIVWRQDLGDNGNTVTQFLIDPQSLDSKQDYTTGMVAMFYFSEDGSRVKVEYVSTYHSLENGEGKDYVYNASKNCFEFTIPEKVEMQPVATENYGIIDAKYSNPVTYPFVAFEKTTDGYAFIGGYYDLGVAENAIINTTSAWKKDFVILMRDNAEARTYKNIGALTASLTLDLNGYQLTQCGNTLLFYIKRDLVSTTTELDTRVKINIKNGTILKAGDSHALFALDYTARCNRPFAIPMTFDNVTFKVTGDGEYSLFYTPENPSASMGEDSGFYANLQATFNNCTFDYKNSAAGVKMLDMTGVGAYDRTVYNVTVNGGQIIAGGAFSKADFIAADGNENGRADTVVFGADAAGNYTKLILPKGTEAPSKNDKYLTVSGEEHAFVRTAYDDETETYTISSDEPVVPPSTSTPYGDIDEEFIDADAYPIVVFYKNGDTNTFVGGYAELGAANKAILNLNASSKDYIILLRNNAAVNTATSVSALTGSYTLDLNGYTLKINYYYAIFIQRNYATTSKRATFTFKNGNIENAYEKGSMICIQYKYKCASPFTVPFVFDNVTFTCSASKSNYGLIRASEGEYNDVADDGFYVDVDVTFNNCIFDLNRSKSLMKMLDMTATDGYDRVVCNLTVNGGSIIAKNSFSYSDLIATDSNANGRADSIKFGKGADGNYTSLLLDSGAAVPPASEVYKSVSGADYAFAKVKDTEDGMLCRLRPVDTVGIDFTPKMSITLDRDLVMNVYVPKIDILHSFTLDGELFGAEELGDVRVETLDSKDYYLVSVPLEARAAARDIKLVARIVTGDKIATGTFTFSIPKYAENIASDGEGEESSLILNVISYIRAAYEYFKTDDDVAMQRMDKILGENYDAENQPIYDGASYSDMTEFASVTFVLNETPSVRFYLAQGADADDYTFFVGGKLAQTVSGTNSKGAYVDIDVYAYALCETVTAKKGDTDLGSFHVNAYYTYVCGESYTGADKAALVALTERFWKYCQSARAYRDSVLAVKHAYVESLVPPTCEGQGYTLHTCSDCGYSYASDYVAAHGHTFGDWYISESVSKTSDGAMRQNCSNCNKFNLKALSVITTGNLGAGTTPTDSAVYTLYEDGTLKVTGSGETYNCAWNCANQPFKEYRDLITRVIVCDGITKLGRGSFGYLKNLEYSDLSDSLTEYPANLFMDSFKSGITSYTIPANITKIQQITIGRYDQKNALFTDVYIENPNIEIVDFTNNNGSIHIFVNRYASNCTDLTLYSYGSSNNVKAYADKHGFKYVDLDASFVGEVGNLSYSFSLGTLTLAPVDESEPAELHESSPWLDKIEKSEVKRIVIEKGIREIPASYFADYTELSEVTVANGISSIGNAAFATESACDGELSITVGDGLSYLGSDFLKNRTNVTLNGFAGTALDGYSQSGVEITLQKAFKLLLIGNSLSNDAADVSVNQDSQLYSLIKSMVGDDVFVQIGVLYSGAKTAAWHATVAESGSEAYTFYLINDDTNGIWKSYSDYTSKAGLTYDAWDYVTLQPYGNEALYGGIDASGAVYSDGTVAVEKFYSLTASIPYLIDRISVWCGTAEIYYYMTWSNYHAAALNGGLTNYNKMLGVAKSAIEYKGTESGRGFDGFIPVGTAIQNARSTYLGLQYYVDEGDSFNHVKGLQRDNVHLNTTVGRYIAGLCFAELLIPEELRLDTYAIPDVRDSLTIGKLPDEFTEIAKLCVEKMINSFELTGDAQYAYIAIEGYESEPSAEAAKVIEALEIGAMTADDKAALIKAITAIAESALSSNVNVCVRILENMEFSDVYNNCTVEITVGYGFANTTVEKTVSARLNAPSAKIVNKNGADAAVTFVIDDGNWATARFAKEMVEENPELNFTFALPVKQVATLAVEDSDGDGIPNYVMVDGKYVYEVNQQSVDFWNDILSSTDCEIVNHSFTHDYFGSNDDGGSFEYVTNSKEIIVSEVMPEGSVTKEIYASKQILETLFPEYVGPKGEMLSFINPGIGVRTIDYTLPDGTVIPSYKEYLNQVIKNAYENGDLIGVNSTFGATYDPDLDLYTKIVTSDNFGTFEERVTIPRYMVEHYNANPEGLVNDDISNWTDYIDAALDINGWACFCIHLMLENESANGHNITEAQAEMLFKYALERNIWIATNTEATLYFSEWATAELETEFENGEIRITLTDGERDDVYNVALTVKVSVPDSWSVAVCGTEAYEVIKAEDGTSYVLIDIVPDSGTVTLTQGNA
ncbi:MAG: DUF4886 domain-containing protein [Clostridia bacterium]|nr:DUF4886 domain-containing protein [Clostridia bacterium]